MKRLFLIALLGAFIIPQGTFAATSLPVAGWLPYWAAKDAAKDADRHLESLASVYPFSYSVGTDGKLKDLADMSGSAWKKLLKDAKAKGVAVIPTVMWSDTTNINKILSSAKSRGAHEDAIVELVKKNGYDGIDIDYEGKLAATAPYYSAFLKELKSKLGSKTLSCTIEARTPPDSLYTKIPANLQYANDYKEINKYCDRVNLMTYDQQRADLKLNASNQGAPYYPVADPAWVKKVIALATKDIDAKKIYLGIPTYGRQVALTVSPNWFQSYSQLGSISNGAAEDLADEHDVTPIRNSAGELSFSYAPTSSTTHLLSSASLTPKSSGKDDVAARALAYANKTGKTVVVNMVWWSDATAIASKVTLAKSLGLGGVAIFKIDGAEDSAFWNSL